MAGDEVAQLYVHDADASFPVPIRQLRDSSGVLSNRGGTDRLVDPECRGSRLFFDTDTGRFDVDPGELDILVGASSEDIRLAGRVTVGGR